MTTTTHNEVAVTLFKTQTPKELLAALAKNNLYAKIGTALSFSGTSLTLNNFFGGYWANFDLTRAFEPQQALFSAFALALGYLAAGVMSDAFRSKKRGLFSSAVISALVVFNLGTESANGGDRAEMGMRQTSIESPEFQTAKQIALNASTQNNSYTTSPALIQAEAKVGELNQLLERCTELHSKEKDINWCQRKPSRELATWDAKYQALLNAEQRQLQLLTTTASNISNQALEKMTQLGRDENNYNMLIRMISRATGLTGFGANLLASFFIVGIIMVCIAWVARNLNNLTEALRLYGVDTEGNPLKTKSRPTPPLIPQAPQKPSVPDTPKPSHYQGTEEEQLDINLPSPERSVPPAPPTKPERPTVPRHPNNRPQHRPETVGHPDSGTPKTDNQPDATVPEDTQKTAMIELLRAVNHGLIQKPSIRPARDILTAAKIGKNKEEREKLARHFYEIEAQPEIIVPADTYGEKGKPFWQFAEGWTPDPSKYQKPEYGV